MARVERHEQIERFATAHLADHDPVRAHAQGAPQQIPDAHQAPTFDVCGAALEAHDVRLAQAKLRCVLDRDHPLRLIDERGEGVEQRRLARAGPATDQDAAARSHRGGELVVELIRERSQLNQLPGPRPNRREPPYRQRRAVHRERRDDDMHPRAVLQAGVHHRAELVHPSTKRRQDPLDRVTQRLLRGEAHIGPLDPAAAFHVDAVVPVHHHLLDCGVGEQLLQGAQADRLAKDQLSEASTGGGLEDRSVSVDQLADRVGQGAQLASRSRLRAAALDQAAPQLGGELVQVPAADTIVHAGLSVQGRRLAPVVFEGKRSRLAWGADVAEIEIQQVDITELAVDAIANAANTQLRHGGGVAGAISRAGGPAVQAESDERAPIGLGEAVETTAGELPCRWVIHAATMELGGPTSAEVIRSATASTLAIADQLGARSLALVAFGTGVGGFPLEEAARVEVEEVRRHLEKGSGLERIVFAVRGESAEAAFRAAIS